MYFITTIQLKLARLYFIDNRGFKKLGKKMKKIISLFLMLLCVANFCFSAGNYNSVNQEYVREFVKLSNNVYAHSAIKDFAKEHPNEVVYAIRNQRVDPNTVVDDVPLAFYMVFTGYEGSQKGDSLRIMKTFIQYGYDINTLDFYHCNILWKAVDCDFDEMVDLLIKSGIDVTVQDQWKETPLMKACLYESRKECALLLAETKKGLDLVDDEGETALIKAIDNKQFDVAKKLIECGADVNLCKKEAYCPLYQACDNNSFELVKLLVENGADVNKKSGYANKTPLFEAMYPDDYEMVKYLLEKGANPNAKDSKYGSTPMFSLNSCRDSRIPEIMIKYGGNINQKDKDGETPFLDVIRFSNKTCINVFKKYKPDYKVLTEEKGNLFHALMDGSLPRTGYGISDSYTFLMGEFEFDEEIIQLLIDNGVDINGKDENGKTPLMKACSIEFDIPELAEALIKYGADPNAVDKDKRSSLWYAVGNPKIMKMLLDNGANPKGTQAGVPLGI